MATYRLTTISTYTDNTCSEDPEDLQLYVEGIMDDILSHWDAAEVTCDVDGKVYTSKGEGNRREGMGPSRLADFPWKLVKDSMPPEDERVLFHDGSEMHVGWISREPSLWKPAREKPEDDFYVVVEGPVTGSVLTRSETEDWWWRKLESPAAVIK